MKEWWKDYFSFTKKERTGAIVLSVLIIATFIAPRFFDQYFAKPADEEMALIRKEMVLIKNPDKDSSDQGVEEKYLPREPYADQRSAVPEKLFYFDPNTLPDEGWKRLGVKEKTIQTIRHYIDKGGKFRKPDDLKRIYGLKPDQAERLIYYVLIKNPRADNNYDKKEKYFEKEDFPAKTNRYKENKDVSIDINLADTSEWIALPGIGSKLAGRIVHFREKLGGFYAIDQVGETFGLADSVFQKIKKRLLISTAGVKHIDINNASLDELKQHPYIRWNIAQAIVRFREQHGAFKSVDDISEINIVNNDWLQKIKPYLTTN